MEIDTCTAVELNALIEENAWRLIAPLHQQMVFRAAELISQGQEVTADEEFWLGEPDYLDDEELAALLEEWEPDTAQVGGALNIEEHVQISQTYEQQVKRLKTTGRAYDVQFQNIEDVPDLHQFMLRAFEYLLDRAFEGARPHDRVGIEIRYVYFFVVL